MLVVRIFQPCLQWSRGSDGTVSTNVTLPVGSSAEVVHDIRLPNTHCELTHIVESGQVVWVSADRAGGQRGAEAKEPLPAGLSSVAREAATAVSVIGSGKYFFSAHYTC